MTERKVESKYSVGDRVAVYCTNIYGDFLRLLGTVETVKENGALWVKYKWDVPGIKQMWSINKTWFHPKQCRKINRKVI